MYRSVAAQLRDQSWTDEPTNGSHVTWTSPDGETVTASGSPGDRKSKALFVKQCRARGAVIDGRGATVKDEQHPGPLIAAAPDDTLADQIRESRGLLAELRTERKAIERARTGAERERIAIEKLLVGLKEQATDLIVNEVEAWFAASDIEEQVKVTLKGIHAAGDRKLTDFATISGKVLRMVDRRVDSRIAELDDVLAVLDGLRNGRLVQATRFAAATPPAYVKPTS
jgi:predicted RNA binding protein YcfA (HicA-like mRNA interferase family)